MPNILFDPPKDNIWLTTCCAASTFMSNKLYVDVHQWVERTHLPEITRLTFLRTALSSEVIKCK